MSKTAMTGLLVVAALVALTLIGCGGGGSTLAPSSNMGFVPSGSEDGVQLAMASPADISAAKAASGVFPAAVPQLVLSISTSLNGTGAVKATSLTKAELLNSNKQVVATATIASGKASFPLTGLAAGFYSIKVNGLVNDLVPTKIDSATASIQQYVGTTLRTTVIGALAAPKYKMQTYSLGQTQKAVVNYSSGLSGTPARYSYAMLYYKTNPKKFEVRVLAKNSLLTTYPYRGAHSFETWIIGSNSHGTSNGGCVGCHGSTTKKVTPYSGIKGNSGWCFKCHYGGTGQGMGFVDPKK